MVALKPDSLLAALVAMLFSQAHTRLRISNPGWRRRHSQESRNVCLKLGCQKFQQITLSAG